jgi:hypothetical protein
MHLSKLVVVLKALDESALKEFERYAASSYFKVPSAAVELFTYLEKLYPEFQERKIQPEIIAKKTTGLPNAGKQAKAGTELLKALEDFIALRDWQSDEQSKTWHQLNAFQKLHLFEQFDKERDRLEDGMNQAAELDIETFFFRHLIAELSLGSFDNRQVRNSSNDLNPVMNTLDEFYAIKKLLYICEALNRRQVLGSNYDIEHINSLLRILQPYATEQYPYVYMFMNVYQMLAAPTYEESLYPYLTIKKLVSKYENSTLPASIMESVTYALNWCLQWNGRGHEHAGEEYLWWIEHKIKWNLLLENDRILPIAFRNVVINATLYGKKPEWIWYFINTYGKNLPEEARETNIAFATGLYHFSLKEFEKAIRYFLNAQAKEEVIFNAVIRRWQWMATYEANPADTDLLLNQILAFAKYLQRNKEEFHQFKAPFNNFITYSKKLVNAFSKEEKQEVANALELEPHFPGKPWILLKLNSPLPQKSNRSQPAFV